MRTFHLPLPEHLHEALRAEATEERRPATEILRQALESWLAGRRKERLAAEIEAYAQAMAGKALDLDADLEAAGVEHLLEGGVVFVEAQGAAHSTFPFAGGCHPRSPRVSPHR